jgi:starch synthase
MSQTINVLFLAAEADPFVKVGGLGDVAGALPRALRALPMDATGEVELDVRLVLPLHPVVSEASMRPLTVFSLQRGDTEVQVEVFETTLDGMPVYFISGEPIRASGSVYSSNATQDGEKYAFFSLAALELPRQINWDVHLIHANDWHTALTVYGNLARRWEEGTRRVVSLITIHNLPFMGPDTSAALASYGIPLAQTDLPEWARVMPLPLGLWASDAMVAVSPAYAEEILNPDFGSGLHEFLQTRRETLHGILNGIDAVSFDPETDVSLAANFSAGTLHERLKNKAALQEKLGLPVEPGLPLLGTVSRMDPQKGVDLIIKALRSLKNQEFQAVILGSGDPKLEEAALQLQQEQPGRIRVETRYDAELARQIYGGADLFLMPSRYEPCGLSQMIAMRYGCVPLVRAIGGLKDTVTEGENGFVFEKASSASLAAAIRRALRVFPNRVRWIQLQQAGMARNFSWASSAKQYFELYKTLVEEHSAG